MLIDAASVKVFILSVDVLGRHLLESRFTGIRRDSQGVPQRIHRVTCLVAAAMFPSKAPQADAQMNPMGMMSPMMGMHPMMGMMNPMMNMGIMNSMMGMGMGVSPPPKAVQMGAGYNTGSGNRITGSAAMLGALPTTRLQDCVAATDDRLDSTFTVVFDDDVVPLLMLLYIFAGQRPNVSVKKLRAGTYFIIVNLRIL